MDTSTDIAEDLRAALEQFEAIQANLTKGLMTMRSLQRTRVLGLFLFLVMCVAVAGCVPLQPYTPRDAEQHWIRECANVPAAPSSACIEAANTGDLQALKWITYTIETKKKDPLEAFRWKMKAAQYGAPSALNEVLKTFANGGIYPANEAKLKEYIDYGVRLGHGPSLMAKAAFLHEVDPAQSNELWLAAAKADYCNAQAMLAASYLKGIFTDVNEAKAYYWWALAKGKRQRAEYRMNCESTPVVADRRLRQSLQSSGIFLFDSGLDSLANRSFAQEVNDLVMEWRPGAGCPSQLDRFRDTSPVAPDVLALETATKPVSVTTPRPAEWSAFRPANPTTLDVAISAEQLYERVGKAVYVVVAGRSKAAFRSRDGLSQGSAVAVDPRTLLTNCHVIEERPVVLSAVRGMPVPLSVASFDALNDTCILKSSEAIFSPVVGIRSSSSLRVGEDVYAIGSPKGFTNSLSKGIVSSVRRLEGRAVIQTTAAISPGSSGGGLFDRFGNLIGITTFKVRDAEGLNFAVAVEQFVSFGDESSRH